MQISRSVLAVNCHGWEDFPTHFRAGEAAELLACWTAMWHPALLSSPATVPTWHRIDEVPTEPSGCLVLVPSFLESNFDSDHRNKILDSGGQVVVGNVDRNAIIHGIAAQIEWPDYSASCVHDFYSLGYCYLQVMLMTRQLRYSSSLDEEEFAKSLEQATQAARDDNSNDPLPEIQSCFDLLIEERNRYYPTDAMLVDYLLLTASTLGRSLQQSLSQPNPLNLQINGETLGQLADRTDTWNSIKSAVDEKRISIVGGQYRELTSCLLSANTCIHQLQKGHRQFEKHVGRVPSAFGRQRFGLTTFLPSVLSLFGQKAAVHSTLDEGVYPQTAANNIRWEGDDGSTIDALASTPLVASAAESFLNLGVKIGEMLDSDHYATILLAHWPGPTGTHYQDLIASSRYGNVLGQFVTIESYFDQCADPGYSQKHTADDYRNPYLAQIADGKCNNPISRYLNYWDLQCRLMAWRGLVAMRYAADPDSPADDSWTANAEKYLDQTSELTESTTDGSTSLATELDADIRSAVDGLLTSHQVANQIGGTLALNPLSFKRRAVIETQAGEKIVELPPMGYAPVADQNNSGTIAKTKKQPNLVDDRFLRNEFFEAEIDEVSGGIRAIQFYNRRGNLMAQQLGMRVPDGRSSRGRSRTARYSTMIADSFNVELNNRSVGLIRTTGRLVLRTAKHSSGAPEQIVAADEQHLANFVQSVRIVRGKPILELDMEIEPLQMPTGTPWDDYYACRFAWNDEAAEIYTYLNESRHFTSRNQIVGPLVVDINHFRFTTSILTCGLPFHRRIGYRRLDSLLIVRGERQRKFKMGIGIDLKYPLTAGIDLICPPILRELPMDSGSTDVRNQRFELNCIFHINCKNVVALDWNPIDGTNGDGVPEIHQGVRVVVKETEGRSVKLSLRCCRRVRRSNKIDFCGNILQALSCADESVQIELAGHELAHLEIFW